MPFLQKRLFWTVLYRIESISELVIHRREPHSLFTVVIYTYFENKGSEDFRKEFSMVKFQSRVENNIVAGKSVGIQR
jgi:hypothetical protein